MYNQGKWRSSTLKALMRRGHGKMINSMQLLNVTI